MIVLFFRIFSSTSFVPGTQHFVLQLMPDRSRTVIPRKGLKPVVRRPSTRGGDKESSEPDELPLQPRKQTARQRPPRDRKKPAAKAGTKKGRQSSDDNDNEQSRVESQRRPAHEGRGSSGSTPNVQFCECCKASSASTKWGAIDPAGQAFGRQCENCRTLHLHCFAYLAWPEMCQKYLQPFSGSHVPRMFLLRKWAGGLGCTQWI